MVNTDTKAWNEGYDYFTTNADDKFSHTFGLADNPHFPDTKEYNDWRQGFNSAAADEYS